MDTIDQIVSIAQDYTADYFTKNVPADVRSDLLFQRAAYVKQGDGIISFAVFTCLDGCPHITLLATKRTHSRQGYGKLLMAHLVSHIQDLGFRCVELMTVLPASKPMYFATVAFYERLGFTIINTYPDLWESGAIKLQKRW